MSIAALSTTTLSTAIDNKQTKFTLASTTGINGTGSLTSPQTMLVVNGEAMLVLNVPVSGVVEVQRGYESKAKAQPSGAIVYFGARSRFAPKAGGAMGLAGTGGNPDGHLPDYRLPLGSRVVDPNGKEYILCDFTATVHSGVTVSISNDGNFTAAPLTTSHQGAVGVVAEATSSSDTWGWVQIYGTASAQIASGDSAATSAMVAIAPSSVSSPDAGMNAIARTSTDLAQIFGMFITGAATTGVTSASSHTGVAVPVFLNYPYVLGYATNVIAPTT